MKRKWLLWIPLVIVVVIAVVGVVMKPRPGPIDLNEYVGEFFARGYDYTPRFDSYEKRSEFVTVADGTRLAVDVFVPTGGPENTRFPTILEYSPYSRAMAQPGMQWWERLFLWWYTNRTEAIYDQALSPLVRTTLGLGYAYVSADMRGTGAAYGSQAPLMPLLGKDGKELVDWIAEQPWSDGNVGMTGQSYLGWSQLATASQGPEALKCIAPAVIVFDTYTEGARPGGIMATKWLREYSDYLENFNLNRLDLEGKYFPYLPAAPVVDEDGDGRLIDEIPLAGQGDPTLFTDDDPSAYADGIARDEEYFLRATLEHEGNMTVSRFMDEGARYFDARLVFEGDTSSYLETSPGAMLTPIIEAQMPVLNIGGWFDGFLKGTTKLYGSIAERGHARLLIGPRFHIPLVVTPAYAEYFGYEGAMTVEVWAEQLRYFDWCLKGIDNGFEGEAPVKIYVMNSGWREENEWPLARQEITPFYLHNDRRLGTESATAGTDSYTVDFGHSSDYGSNRLNRWLLMQAPDTLMLRTELDKKTLVYETTPLASDIEVTGHPIVHLWLSSDQDAGDVFVYLSDVDESGEVHYVTEGQLRAGFRGLFDPNMQTGHAVEVRPDLPWHGFRATDFTEAVFADGRVVDLRFDLIPTSWLFRAGHRIRISIAGADYGNFELNPALCTADDPNACDSTTLHIHRGAATPSRIELPVIVGG